MSDVFGHCAEAYYTPLRWMAPAIIAPLRCHIITPVICPPLASSPTGIPPPTAWLTTSSSSSSSSSSSPLCASPRLASIFPPLSLYPVSISRPLDPGAPHPPTFPPTDPLTARWSRPATHSDPHRGCFRPPRGERPFQLPLILIPRPLGRNSPPTGRVSKASRDVISTGMTQ